MAEFFYELCLILKSQLCESKHKQQVKIISNKTTKMLNKLFSIQLFYCILHASQSRKSKANREM